MKLWVLIFAVFFLCIVSCAKDQPEPIKTPDIAPLVKVQPEPVQAASAVQEEPEPVFEAAVVHIIPKPEPESADVKVFPEPVPEAPVVQTAPSPVSQPGNVQVLPEPAVPQPVVLEPAPPPLEYVFEFGTITKVEFDTAKSEIQKLVEDLNKIIKAGNYNTWLTYLGEDYRQRINSKNFLNDLMEKYPSFKGKINSARDYFNYVVVPSRTNDRVDDIEFISKNEVYAYTEDAKGQTVVLYHLKNLDGKWKITY